MDDKPKPTIEVEFSMTFGRETFYACDGMGELLLTLMGRKSFTREKIDLLKKYFDIRVKEKTV